MVATKEEVQGYFSPREGDQDADVPELIPSARKGGPINNLCLLQMGEDDVTVEHGGDESKNPGHPYVLFFSEVLAPEEFEEIRIKGMFYFPVMPEDTSNEKAMKKFDSQMRKNIGQVDAVLGEGTWASLNAESLEDGLNELVTLLDGVSFVGEIGIEKAKKGWPAKNRINKFAPSDTWTEESN